MNAVIYARFSWRPENCKGGGNTPPSSNEPENHQSIDAQLRYCRAYCAKHEYTVRAEYHDDRMSGADHERPALWAAVSDLRRGEVMVVYSVDRLAREVLLAETIERAVRQKRARIEYVQGGALSATPEAALQRQIFQSIAEYQRCIINARTKYAMLRHQQNGRKMSGCPPYGMELDPDTPGRLRPSPEEQTALGRIRALRHDGWSMRAIADQLTADGLTPRGSKWTANKVQKIAKREGYDKGPVETMEKPRRSRRKKEKRPYTGILFRHGRRGMTKLAGTAATQTAPEPEAPMPVAQEPVMTDMDYDPEDS